jgi:hypothetical protein
MIVAQSPEPRSINLCLMAAIYVAPAIFWWFLLRRGHANSTRIAAFLYAATTFAIGFVGTAGL